MKLKDLPEGSKVWHVVKIEAPHSVITTKMKKMPGAKGLYCFATHNGKERFMGNGTQDMKKFGDYWHRTDTQEEDFHPNDIKLFKNCNEDCCTL